MKNDLYVFALALLTFIFGGIFDSGLLFLAGWTLIIAELFYILIKTW